MNVRDIRDQIKEYELLNVRDIRYIKDDKLGCRVKCIGQNYEQIAFASNVGGSMTYKLRIIKEKHTCDKNFKGYFTSSSWIIEKLSAIMKLDQRIKLLHIIKNVKYKNMVEMLVTKAYCMEILQGAAIEQYIKIWDDYEKIRTRNLSSTLKVQIHRPIINQ